MTKFNFLIEEEFGSNSKFTIYVPELRISGCGDTLQEAQDNTIDVIKASFETTSSSPKIYRTKVVEIELDLMLTDSMSSISKAM